MQGRVETTIRGDLGVVGANLLNLSLIVTNNPSFIAFRLEDSEVPEIASKFVLKAVQVSAIEDPADRNAAQEAAAMQLYALLSAKDFSGERLSDLAKDLMESTVKTLRPMYEIGRPILNGESVARSNLDAQKYLLKNVVGTGIGVIAVASLFAGGLLLSPFLGFVAAVGVGLVGGAGLAIANYLSNRRYRQAAKFSERADDALYPSYLMVAYHAMQYGYLNAITDTNVVDVKSKDGRIMKWAKGKVSQPVHIASQGQFEESVTDAYRYVAHENRLATLSPPQILVSGHGAAELTVDEEPAAEFTADEMAKIEELASELPELIAPPPVPAENHYDSLYPKFQKHLAIFGSHAIRSNHAGQSEPATPVQTLIDMMVRLDTLRDKINRQIKPHVRVRLIRDAQKLAGKIITLLESVQKRAEGVNAIEGLLSTVVDYVPRLESVRTDAAGLRHLSLQTMIDAYNNRIKAYRTLTDSILDHLVNKRVFDAVYPDIEATRKDETRTNLATKVVIVIQDLEQHRELMAAKSYPEAAELMTKLLPKMDFLVDKIDPRLIEHIVANISVEPKDHYKGFDQVYEIHAGLEEGTIAKVRAIKEIVNDTRVGEIQVRLCEIGEEIPVVALKSGHLTGLKTEKDTLLAELKTKLSRIKAEDGLYKLPFIGKKLEKLATQVELNLDPSARLDALIREGAAAGAGYAQPVELLLSDEQQDELGSLQMTYAEASVRYVTMDGTPDAASTEAYIASLRSMITFYQTVAADVSYVSAEQAERAAQHAEVYTEKLGPTLMQLAELNSPAPGK